MPKPLQESDLAKLILLAALLFGGWLRFYPVLQAGFPINDGGMFYQMTLDLLSANWRLPEYTTYNHLNIPFAYPPLAFYLTGLLHTLSGISLMELIRWIPAFFSILTLGAFHLLARELLQNTSSAAWATLFFAFIPRAYEWSIMGGGLTRSPGFFFYLLVIFFTVRFLRDKQRRHLVGATVLGTLLLLTHPERSLHAAGTIILLWLFWGRTWKKTVSLFLAGMGVLLLSSPWWGTVLARHGLAPFLFVGEVTNTRWSFWLEILQTRLTDETFPVVALLALIGLGQGIFQRRYFLPAWLAFSYLLEPRSAYHIVSVQAALLAGQGLIWFVYTQLARISKQKNIRNEFLLILRAWPGRIFGILLLCLLALNGAISSQSLRRNTLSQEHLDAMRWIAENTPADSKFLVISWREHPMLSPEIEWFPALSGRSSQATLQGREWLPGKENYQFLYKAAHELNQCDKISISCIESWSSKNEIQFEYIYLSLREKKQTQRTYSLLRANNFQLIYQSSGVQVFQISQK